MRFVVSGMGAKLAFTYTLDQAQRLIDDFENAIYDIQTTSLKVILTTLHLKSTRAIEFVKAGICRRLKVIEHSATQIFDIFPPNKLDRLTADECTNVTIFFQAFAINVYGVFDNAAWVAVLEAGAKVKKERIGPYKDEARKHFPQPFLHYLDTPSVRVWFKEYGKPYRDSTAHTLPPYLPPAVVNEDDGKVLEELCEQQNQLFQSPSNPDLQETLQRLEENADLHQKMGNVGRNSILIANSSSPDDENPPIILHQQIINDLLLMKELMDAFCASFKPSATSEFETLILS